MNQNSEHMNPDSSQRWNKTRTQQQTNSKTLEQQKSNCWTPVGPIKDKSSGPSQLNHVNWNVNSNISSIVLLLKHDLYAAHKSLLYKAIDFKAIKNG